MTNRTANAIAATLLSVHAALLAYAATRHSPTIDEVGHMAAGLSHWRFGRFDLYRVNPPLVRLVAAAPVALARPKEDWNGYSLLPRARSEFPCGERFIAINGGRSFWLFSIARWACIPFSLLGGFICYRWAGELYGASGGLLSATLWCFSPNVLAHAELITPDVGGAALAASASYLFWRWLREPSWARAIGAGLALGAAELAKSTFVLFYAIWPLAWLVWIFREMPLRRANALAAVGQFFVMLALGVYVINLGYGFENVFRPLGKFTFLSETFAGPRDLAGARPAAGNRFKETWLANIPVPLPANYVLGIDRQKIDFERGLRSYLRGTWKHRGWWYYYLYCLAVKVPLGTWALFVMAVSVGLVEWKQRRRAAIRPLPEGEGVESPHHDVEGATWRDELVLLLPAAAILAFVSSQTGFSHHLRYISPIYPFVFIWIGRLGSHVDLGARRFIAAFRRIRTRESSGTVCDTASPQPSPGGRGSNAPAAAAALTGLALAWSITSSLWYYPHSLSYFNELVGGPRGGRWHLLDSNIDWGQDLLHLKRWLDEHPEARPLGLAYFGQFDARVAGIEFSLPPVGPTGESKAVLQSLEPEALGPLPGWYAVSLMMLHGCLYGIPDGKGGTFSCDRPYFTYFQKFEPVATAGYSIYIYHLGVDDVARVRRELGLRALAASGDLATITTRGGEVANSASAASTAATSIRP